MKNVLLFIGLSLVTVTAFAQKKNVSAAERISKEAKPNYDEARNLIKSALEDPETKNDAKTWYVAGKIEDKQFTDENMKQILGQQPNEPVMYEALANSLPHFMKAYELDQLPNEKGKVKPRFAKSILGTLSANHVYYLNGGAYYFDQRDYRKACNFFEQYLEISDSPFFRGEKISEKDSSYMIVQFYLAVASTQLDDSEMAIRNLKRAKDTPYRQNEVYQYLCYEYEQIQDSVNLEKTLEEGLAVFPDSSYYLLHLISLYISSNRDEQALQHLNTAITRDPNNSDLYQAMGSVYESKKDYTKAEESYLKAVEIAPESPTALSNIGRVYYNQGVVKLAEANLISDATLYNQEKGVAKELFKKALPYFEKAYKTNPDERQYMVALRGIYYNLDMGEKFAEIEAKMNQ
ncbi:MAG: tetratricopeptide repeat protein [Tannerella sp.]|jgi:tetratricopeptide (TPR) repeat protein|nr:tetratricopeptide repeat protein [Tannerella sp.]